MCMVVLTQVYVRTFSETVPRKLENCQVKALVALLEGQTTDFSQALVLQLIVNREFKLSPQ